MGEDAGRDAGTPGGHAGFARVTIAEAARRLGVKEPAVRKRMQRGTLRHDKGEDGRTYVYLDAGEDAGRPAGGDDRDERIEELKDQVRYLREVVASRDEEIRRRDHLLAAALERIPELETSREGRGSPTEGAETSGGVEDRPAGGGAQEGARRRPWWRRWLGG